MTRYTLRSHAPRGNGLSTTLCVDAGPFRRRGVSQQVGFHAERGNQQESSPHTPCAGPAHGVCRIRSPVRTAAALPATAQTGEPPPPGFEGATVVEKPNAQVPLDLEFSDEDGRTVRLGDFFKPDRPVLLVPVYFQCPMLCNLTLNGMVKAIGPLRLTPG